MQLQILKPKQSLNKAFLKEKLSRAAVDLFKHNFSVFMNNTSANQGDEEHLKSQLAYFLRDTWYKDSHHINPVGKNDLVIHTGKSTADPVGVIVEVKSINNRVEMISSLKPNVKAFHELVLYYLRQKIEENNNGIKFLIASNIDEWYLFDANEFDKKIYRNSAVKKLYELKKSDNKDNPWFYDELKKLLELQSDLKLEVTHFSIREFEHVILNDDPKDDSKLIAIYKLLSPVNLLKLPFANDSNSLQPKFYAELLHIIGLTEIKEGSKKLIQRRKEGERNSGSLLESTIIALDTHDKISRLNKPSQYGENHEERLFNVGLELVITWINRILFLKLLEAQLSTYHKGDKSYNFLNKEKVKDYDDLDKLFFSVLAKKPEERREEIQNLFAKVPYLNSSLFEPTELEHQTLFIHGLEDRLVLPVLGKTVLSDEIKKAGSLNTIDYLFAFLDAYDFSSEGSEEIQEDNKTLINASVLGLIFEKINGYKDGSFFTPGFITMYMCRETIRRAVVQKFNESKDWACKEYDELYDKIVDRAEANRIVSSLKICDPAVGSGHFLVSALNEIIAIKSDLRILSDREGHRLKEYHVEVVNDELVITDEEGQLFEYNPNSKESQRMQEALFHEKQSIIENCLFGVDINPNSVKICRLRLWIELLKNAYYKPLSFGDGFGVRLETLPNIDINIKTGNSLISRFALDADLKQALKKSKFGSIGIESYKHAVRTYRNTKSKDEKREMERLIEAIKSDFQTEIGNYDPRKIRLAKVEEDYFLRTGKGRGGFGLMMFEGDVEYKSENSRLKKQKDEKDLALIKKLRNELDEIKNSKIYENAFEWRFEFPDVLNDDGDFVGFDVVIGNPPYVPSKNLDESEKAIIYDKYKTAEYQINTFGIFSELAIKVLKPTGCLCYILPNYWLSNKYDKRLRNLLFIENKTTDIVNVYGVFESAVVETLLLFTEKGLNEQGEISIRSIDRNITTIEKRLDAVKNSNWSFENRISTSTLSSDLIISFEAQFQIAGEFSIGDFFDLKFGAKLYEVGKGIPKQGKDDSKNKIYESNIKLDDRYIKLLRARNIQRFYLRPEDYYVKYGENLAAPRISSLFIGPRLLIQRIVSRETLDATYTEGSFICNTDIITLKPKSEDIDLQFFLGIICSKLCAKVLRSRNVNLDRSAFPKINTETLATFPIPKPNSKCKKISDVVNQILDAKNEEFKSDTTFLEKEIDQLVYQLYGLTEEEIKIVEGM